MEEFLVHQVDHGPAASQAVTHAMVIGVGTYPHLVGGTQSLSPAHGGMGQLTSPPVSARRFTEWLVNSFHHPHKPLATVSLLLSEGQTTPQTDVIFTSSTGQSIDVEYPSIGNTKQAIREWRRRGDENPENLLIFYFCGHGIGRGNDTSLLLADFGREPNNVLEDAIDFSSLQKVMKRCKAKEQIYFVDACRVGSGAIIEELDYLGDPIMIIPTPPINGIISTIFYSTLAGELAFGRNNAPSYFTDSLLRALNGEGAQDSQDEGSWRISTSRLKEAIDMQMNRAAEDGFQRLQISPADGLFTFEFHYLQNAPSVHVRVCCEPENALESARLSCQSPLNNQTIQERQELSETPWDIVLPAGSYLFEASFPNSSFSSASRTRTIRPPYPIVKLQTTPTS